MFITAPTANNTPSFSGLTGKFRRQVFIDGKKDISSILEKMDPQKNTYVGELPPFIFNAIPKDKRPQVIKEFFQTFDKISDEIREFKPGLSSPKDEYQNRRPQSCVKELKALFSKYNLITDSEKFDIKYLGCGEYKKAFKIEGAKDSKTGDEMCFKVFHKVDKTPEWHKYKSHGNFAEINIAEYWKKRVGWNTQRGNFYFGDIKHGYMADRYVTKDTPKPQKLINEYSYGIKITDEAKSESGHNKLYGYSIDEGGSRVVNRVKNQSKVARYVLNCIKKLPYNQRQAEWYRILETNKNLEDTQKKAGLALCIRHLHNCDQGIYMDECLKFHKPLVDTALSYALKYLPEEQSKKYFEILMKRKDPTTQTVLMNEIPLLSREQLGETIDDLDVPRGEIDSKKIKEYYKIAQKYVLPEVEEHLASYVHLLPTAEVLPEADKLIEKKSYNINDRFLHKIKFVHENEFPFGDKMAILDKVENSTDNEFIKNKARDVRTKIIRDSLDD